MNDTILNLIYFLESEFEDYYFTKDTEDNEKIIVEELLSSGDYGFLFYIIIFKSVLYNTYLLSFEDEDFNDIMNPIRFKMEDNRPKFVKFL